ncbi:MAG: hypothetical protein NVS3B16_14940 [Vulcanimicrobiaceae bacterium]
MSAARHELPRVLPLYRDARVPLAAKIAALAAAAFNISPLNILGESPLLGFFDDAALLAFVIHYFVRFAEGRIANEIVPARKTATSASIALGDR